MNGAPLMVKHIQDINMDTTSESDYYSCYSDYEDGNLDFSLDRARLLRSNSVSSVDSEILEGVKPHVIVAPAPRSPIDITIASKRISHSRLKTVNTPNVKSVLIELLVADSIETNIGKLVLGRLNHPVAPIMTANDPYFEINKRYEYSLFLQDQQNRAAELYMRPVILRFFPFSTQETKLSVDQPVFTKESPFNHHRGYSMF